MILFGISILVYAGTLIYEANNIDTEHEKISKTESKLGELTTLNMRGEEAEWDSTKYIKINFETLEVFSGDTIEITVSAPYASTNLKEIAVIVADPDFYFGDDNQRILKNIANQPIQNIIELIPNTTPPFQTSQNVKFFRPYQEVVIYAMSFGQNGTITKYQSEVNFIVRPESDKLQVKTNNAILEQINETKIANIEQKKTNDIFLGLAWIGVAVIPILAGTDILLRIHFED